jgi:hypothetical protein
VGSTLTPKERSIRRKLRDDFPHYARKCLKIRTKDGRILTFELNAAQQYIHQRCEDQKAETGRVRALVIKGRQQGCSTYVEGRFFHQVTWHPAMYAFILTHEDKATQNLFGMAERYYQHCPAPVKPHAGTANAKEMHFDLLDSGYRVATAGQKEAGRSGTVQLFHGSEVAFWPNAESHLAGAMQQVPDLPGTEVILESTSAGATGMFYTKCAETATWRCNHCKEQRVKFDVTTLTCEKCGKPMHRAHSDYQLIFVPWFWQEEYSKTVKGFEPTEDEGAYAALHGLDNGQLAWRRSKIQELGGVHVFRREYPATVEEAFRAEMPGALWKRDTLDLYRRAQHPEPLSLVGVGVDPSTTSKETSDECGIIVAGKGRDGHAYILDDGSGVMSPNDWGNRAVRGFDEFKADSIVYEANQGGDMVIRVIQSTRVEFKQDTGTGVWYPEPLPYERKLLPLRAVWASRGKQARAHPIARLYDQGLVHHVGHFPNLEDEMCSWVPGETPSSPNRIDALVWVLTWIFDLVDGGVPAVDDLSRESGWRNQ